MEQKNNKTILEANGYVFKDTVDNYIVQDKIVRINSDELLSKISGKEMKGFVRQYAATHEDFATALVEKYWKPERGNYKEQVEACFAHAGVLGKRFGEPNWTG